MKRFLLPIIAAAIGIAGYAADVERVYIVPFQSDGTVARDGSVYTDTIPMTEQPDGSYAASGVELAFGFQFYAMSASGGTLYSIAYWAVNPAVQVLPNPLSITASDDPIQLEAGTYDIEFYTSEQSGQTYKLFTATPIGTDRVYPSRIFLIYGNSTQELGGDGTGIYKGVLNTTDPFRISYEPRTGIYVFGPTAGSNVELQEGIKQTIEHGVGINATLAYSDPQRLNPEITVSLVDGNSYVLIGEDAGETGQEDISMTYGQEESTSTYYTLSGIPVAKAAYGVTPTLTPGIYLVRNGSKVVKRYISR